MLGQVVGDFSVEVRYPGRGHDRADTAEHFLRLGELFRVPGPLGGALVALNLLGRIDLRDALWHGMPGHGMREPALADANAISRAHLTAAAQGLGSAALHAVLNDILTGTTAALPRRLAAVEAIGHTSGWDALAGAVLVLREGGSNPQRPNLL